MEKDEGMRKGRKKGGRDGKGKGRREQDYN